MLVFKRRPGEKIVIREAGITMTIVAIGKHWVKIGVDAPQNLDVHREEVQLRIDSGEEPDRSPAA